MNRVVAVGLDFREDRCQCINHSCVQVDTGDEVAVCRYMAHIQLPAITGHTSGARASGVGRVGGHTCQGLPPVHAGVAIAGTALAEQNAAIRISGHSQAWLVLGIHAPLHGHEGTAGVVRHSSSHVVQTR